MSTGRITIVAGSGRCGSSLVMQMLHRAGVSLIAEHSVSFEASQWTERWLADPSVIEEASGRVVKLLCPMLDVTTFPYDRAVDWIWCSRNLSEQVRSQVKFAHALFGLDLPAKAVRKMIAHERTQIHSLIAAEPHQRLLDVTFERLCRAPVIEAGRIVDFLKLDATVRDLAGVVVPRDSTCYPGFLETVLIDRGAVIQSH